MKDHLPPRKEKSVLRITIEKRVGVERWDVFVGDQEVRAFVSQNAANWYVHHLRQDNSPRL